MAKAYVDNQNTIPAQVRAKVYVDNLNYRPTDPATIQAPEAPTLTGLVAVNGAIRVSWQVPAYDGNSEITNYRITAVSTAGTVTTTVGSQLGGTVGPLVNGLQYTVTVMAINAAGFGAPSNKLTARPDGGVINDPDPDPGGGTSGDQPQRVALAVPLVSSFPARYHFTPQNWRKQPSEAI